MLLRWTGIDGHPINKNEEGWGRRLSCSGLMEAADDDDDNDDDNRRINIEKEITRSLLYHYIITHNIKLHDHIIFTIILSTYQTSYLSSLNK